MSEIYHSYDIEVPTSKGPNARPSEFHAYTDSQDTKPSFYRKWLASSAELQPLNDPNGAGGNGQLTAQWGIHWYTPVSIVLLLILGIGSAVGHHVFYTILDGTPARKQEWVTRIGTALAFLCRASFAAAAEISRNQWLWVTLRERFMTLAGIDAMFGVTSDPTFFTNPDILKHAKLSTLMALLIWMFPLAAILTPSTIAVVSADNSTSIPCTVRTMLFDYDTGSIAKRLPCDDPSEWCFTLGEPSENQYKTPSLLAFRILSLPAFSDAITTPNNTELYKTNTAQTSLTANETTIGQDCGRNCTYSIVFLAPAVQCTKRNLLNETDAPWDNSKQFQNETTYYAERSKVAWNTLWIRYTPGVKTNSTEPHVYSCQNSVARYTVKLDTYDYQFQRPTIEDYQILYPVNDEPSTSQNSAMYTPSWVFFDTLMDVLGGNATAGAFSTKAIYTSLYIVGDGFTHYMDTKIEDMARKMVVSLLSANLPGTKSYPSGSRMIYAAQTKTNCTSNYTQNIYQYITWQLVSVYSIATFVVLSIAVLGFVALEKNGVTSDTSFSTILLMTRNPTLDKLTLGACFGGDPVPKQMQGLKLRFGEIRARETRKPEGEPELNRVRHLAFGIKGEEDVLAILKGGKYS